MDGVGEQVTRERWTAIFLQRPYSFHQRYCTQRNWMSVGATYIGYMIGPTSIQKCPLFALEFNLRTCREGASN